MHKKHLVIPMLALALTGSALASGSGPLRPPRPPRDFAPAGEEMDSARYALGKSVFSGKAPHVSNPSAAKKQKVRLGQLATAAGKSGASLPALAGQLSSEQMDALDYYVSKRFGTR